MRRGFILPLLVTVILVFLIMVPAVLKWISTDTKHSIREERKSKALYLAEAAVERGYWKVKSSTITFGRVISGYTLEGYNFDITYYDIEGGSYRIKISSGSAREVVIVGEGRDRSTGEIRAVRVKYRNQTIAGAMLSGSKINPSGDTRIHWGPILSWGEINLSAGAQNVYYPRKFSKQLVKPRDHSLDPPNTDNKEWWSAYDVPELPMFDFATIRSSAQANGTLNCGSANPSKPIKPESSNNYTPLCNCTGDQNRCCADRNSCYFDNIYAHARFNDNLIWYWDEGKSVYLNNTGIKGSIFVRGDLRIDGDDCYGPWYKTYGYDPYGGYHTCGPSSLPHTSPGALFVDVPKNAYIEYAAIDTSAPNQYPGDLGLSSSSLVYQIGACDKSLYYECNTSCEKGCERAATGDDIGLYGFLYVGGNLKIYGAFDIYGAIWVVGDINTGSGNNVAIFFNENLELPTLNVVLIRQSWEEIPPSNIPWA